MTPSSSQPSAVDAPSEPTRQEIEEILALLDRLPARNPTRQIAFALLKRKFRPPGTIRPLLEPLTDPSVRRWREREVAAWVLGRALLAPAQAETAARTLADVLEDALPPDTRRVWRGFARWLLLALLLSLPTALLFGSRMGVEPPLLVMVAFFVLALIVLSALLVIPAPLLARSLAVEDQGLNRVRAAAATALGRMGAAGCAGTLAGALFDHSPRVRDAAKAALYTTLPVLTPDHYGALDSQAVPNLCRALNHAEERLVLAVLEALEKMGDGRALPHVARLAAGTRTSRIQQAAARALPVLQERRRQEQAPGMLLRPAEPPGIDASLVRAADLSLRQVRYEQVILPPEEKTDSSSSQKNRATGENA